MTCHEQWKYRVCIAGFDGPPYILRMLKRKCSGMC